jgi:glucosamine--fructose-6-phosphate aminotransferase (isomerizing)
VVALLAQAAAAAVQSRPPAGLIAITNDLSSPLAEAAALMQAAQPGAGWVLPLNAEPEQTPSTRTYLLTLAIGQLMAKTLAAYSPQGGSRLRRHFDDLGQTLDGIEDYLRDWEDCLGEVGAALAGVDERASAPPLVLVGRGLSYSSAMAGALNLQEAGKIPALGMQAAEFRHGPLEIAPRGRSVLVFEGGGGMQSDLTRKLWVDLRRLGVRAHLLAASEIGDEPGVLRQPAAAGIGLPLAEIVPVQLLCVYLALKAGLTPGEFRHIGKVTTEE